MDLVQDIIAASKKPPVIIKRSLNSENPPKKVHFEKNIPKKQDNSRRLAGFEASSISSEHGRKKAQEVVLHLIDNTVTAKELEEMCQHIIPGQYEDVCLERCIAGVCGYPLCNVPYRDNYGNKEVVFRSNKVYDISRRRNYCSDVCFEASVLVCEQISFTPHYLREHETQEELSVVVPDSSKLRGRRGDLKDIGGDTEFEASLRKMRQERLRQKSQAQFSRTVEEAALAGLLAEEERTAAGTKVPDQDTNKHFSQDEQMTQTATAQNIIVKSQHNCTKTDTSENAIENNNDQNVKNIKKNKKKRKPNNNPEVLSNEICDPIKLVDRGVASNKNDTNVDDSVLSTARLDNQATNATVCDSAQRSDSLDKLTECSDKDTARVTRQDKDRSHATTKEEFVRQVEEHLLEWFTWESYVLVLGENYLQGLLENHGIMNNHLTEQQPAFESALDSDVCRLRYWRLCSQLARQERLEELEAASVAAEDRPRPSKDVPDMETLRQDVQNMTLKVKCFLGGREEPEPEDLTPVEGEEQRIEANPLPLVDCYEQRAWRRKVFFENVHKAEGAVVAGLSLSGEEVRPLLSRLITSFNLTAHNLYLKTPQWSLVLLSLLKLLGVRSAAISSALSDIELLQCEVWPRLSALALPHGYLDTLMFTLLSDKTIMDKFMNGSVAASTTIGAVQDDAQPKPSSESTENYSALEELD